MHRSLGKLTKAIIRRIQGRRGIRGTRSGDFVDPISFVNLCKASWLCGKLLSSHQYQTLDANSLWHPYIGKIAEVSATPLGYYYVNSVTVKA